MNLLDQAKKASKTTTKTAVKKPGVPTLQCPDDYTRTAVDKVRKAITAKKQAEADLDNYGEVVRDLFLETKETEARAGNFRKSFRFEGHKENVMVKHANKALKINYDDVPQIKKILTDRDYDLLLEETAQIFVKPEVLEPNSALGAKLLKMLGKTDEQRNENFALFFESKVGLKVKADFDRNIFRLPMKAFNALKVYVKLQNPGLQ